MLEFVGETVIENNCDLVGVFGIFVQVLLVLLIFTAVKVKHHFERPRRVLKLFFMDGSKQLLSNSMLHIMNVVLAVAVSTSKQHDQCGVYFTALLLDVTLGLAITYGLVVLSNRLLSVAFTRRLKSGNYFKGVRRGEKVVYVIDYGAWIKQILVWLLLVLVVGVTSQTKLLVLVVQITLKEAIATAGDRLMDM